MQTTIGKALIGFGVKFALLDGWRFYGKEARKPGANSVFLFDEIDTVLYETDMTLFEGWLRNVHGIDNGGGNMVFSGVTATPYANANDEQFFDDLGFTAHFTHDQEEAKAEFVAEQNLSEVLSRLVVAGETALFIIDAKTETVLPNVTLLSETDCEGGTVILEKGAFSIHVGAA